MPALILSSRYVLSSVTSISFVGATAKDFDVYSHVESTSVSHMLVRLFDLTERVYVGKVCKSFIYSHRYNMADSLYPDFSMNTTGEIIFYDGDKLKSKTANVLSLTACGTDADLSTRFSFNPELHICIERDSTPGALTFSSDDPANSSYKNDFMLVINGHAVGIRRIYYFDTTDFSLLAPVVFANIIKFKSKILEVAVVDLQ
ncbi:uncharacterized protein LOC132193607 [Neocloeon triangulifer]|uniref:uncharacterized protein LOC132193607 n=1 Tax=Neocloeon triangulifer TaxID=2078957 RepID=UPI00286F80BB|nr:uncharacterized protein LOC132193607 [Neocloeon triangulifer]